MRRLFSAVLDFLFPPRADEMLVRACEALPPIRPISEYNVVSLLPFRMPVVRAAIHEAKYKDNQKAQRLLADSLASYLETIGGAYVLLPLPLSRERLRERGFNQCELIAQLAGATMDTSVLTRIRDTEHQARLSREERLANVRGAFRAEGADPSLLYIVLDDVLTTGSTMREAVKALETAGATRIRALALAS